LIIVNYEKKIEEIKEIYDIAINQFLIRLSEIDEKYNVFGKIEFKNMILNDGKYKRKCKIDTIILNDDTVIFNL